MASMEDKQSKRRAVFLTQNMFEMVHVESGMEQKLRHQHGTKIEVYIKTGERGNVHP